MFHVVCLCAVSKEVTLIVSEHRYVQVNAGSRRLISAIKSSKSAAVKSRLIDQEVIFPFFLKTCYRGHI